MTPRFESAGRARTAGWIALLALLLVYGVHQARGDFPYQYAFDLYHPWAIARAADTPGAPSNPYTQTAAYGELAAQTAAGSASTALHAAARFWEGRNSATRFEPTGTPLYYAALAFLPRDYDSAHQLMALVQFACLGAAIVMLGRLRGWGWWPTLCAAALAWCTFNPFTQDVKFANAASIQAACIAGLIVLASRGWLERNRLIDRAYLAALVLLVLFKPNTVLIAAALAAHYHFTRGTRRLAESAVIAALIAFAAAALSSWRFHDAGVWIDWYRYTQGMNGGTLLYPAADGNLSLVKMLSERAGSRGFAVYSAIAALLFVAALALALTARGRAPQRLLPGARAVVADPWLMASAAVLATFLVSPLVWPHYWVLLVIPMLRFVAWEGRWDASTTWTVVAYVALSRAPLQVLLDVAPPAIYSFMLFSWMPLLAALVIQVARTASASRSPRHAEAAMA
jgi:hypothetical protein